jgi:Toxin SymE, type I toxin-antitoxin system
MAISHSTTPESAGAQSISSAQTPSPKRFQSRRLTVGDYTPTTRWWPKNGGGHEQEKRHPRAPYLRLKGRWLDQAGFPIGARVRVEASPGRLTIELEQELPERRPHLPRRPQQLFF